MNQNDLKLIDGLKNIPYLIDLINKQDLNEYIKQVVGFLLMQINILTMQNPGHLKRKILRE